MRQQPSGQRRRRRLAVCTGEDDRAGPPQEVIANRLRQRAVAELALENRLELRIAAGDGVAHHHEVDVVGDVLRRVTGECRDPLRDEEVAHRRIDLLIRSLHVVAAALEQRRQRGHGGAADADQMDAQLRSGNGRILDHDAAGAGLDSTRTSTPNGSVQHGPLVWPDGNPNSTGPGKSAVRRAMTSRAVTAPPGSSQPRISPNTSARARPSTPLSRKLRQHAVDAVRPLVDVLEKQHAAVRRRRTRTASRATRSVARSSRRRADPAPGQDEAPRGPRARAPRRCHRRSARETSARRSRRRRSPDVVRASVRAAR